MSDATTSDARKALIEHVAAGLWTDEYAKMLQGILDSGLSAMQAYCVGIATVYIVESVGVLPKRSVLLQAAKCQRIPEAIAIGERYAEQIQHAKRKGESNMATRRRGRSRGQQQARQETPAVAAMPGIKPNQLRQIQKQVGQLMSIGTNLNAFIQQFSGRPAVAAAGSTAGSSARRSKPKTQAAGANTAA